MFSFFKKKINEGYEALKKVFGTKSIDSTKKINEIENFLLENNIKLEIIKKILNNFDDSDLNKVEKIRENLRNLIDLSFKNENLNSDKEVFLLVGINGSGKTTSLIKLARFFKSENNKTLIVPCDTFRAAAYEQLKFLAENEKIDFFENEKLILEKKTDPATLIYKSINENSENYKKILIDTAGRIHQDESLLRELKKIHKIASERSQYNNFTLKTFIVLDSLQGNSLEKQIKEFSSIVKIDGIILTKLDSGAKPGNIVSIIDSYKIPVVYLAYGEYKTDIVPFQVDLFLDLLIGAKSDIDKK